MCVLQCDNVNLQVTAHKIETTERDEDCVIIARPDWLCLSCFHLRDTEMYVGSEKLSRMSNSYCVNFSSQSTERKFNLWNGKFYMHQFVFCTIPKMHSSMLHITEIQNKENEQVELLSLFDFVSLIKCLCLRFNHNGANLFPLCCFPLSRFQYVGLRLKIGQSD